MTCYASYVRKSYNLSVFIPFMLYMPDSTQFMQEMTNKDQERSSWTKVCSLKRTSTSEQPTSSLSRTLSGRLWEIYCSLKRTISHLSVQNVQSKGKFAHKHAYGTLERSSSTSEDKVPRGSFSLASGRFSRCSLKRTDGRLSERARIWPI